MQNNLVNAVVDFCNLLSRNITFQQLDMEHLEFEQHVILLIVVIIFHSFNENLFSKLFFVISTKLDFMCINLQVV